MKSSRGSAFLGIAITLAVLVFVGLLATAIYYENKNLAFLAEHCHETGRGQPYESRRSSTTMVGRVPITDWHTEIHQEIFYKCDDGIGRQDTVEVE